MDFAQKEVRLRQLDLDILNARKPAPPIDEIEAAKKELAEAQERAAPLIEAYKALPEEADAYRIGEEAAKAFTAERLAQVRKAMEALGP
jgi:hypothetical protein